MIVVGTIGQNVFDITSVSVPTFYIVHRFHLSMSNAILFVVDLVVDLSPSCSIMCYWQPPSIFQVWPGGMNPGFMVVGLFSSTFT